MKSLKFETFLFIAGSLLTYASGSLLPALLCVALVWITSAGLKAVGS